MTDEERTLGLEWHPDAVRPDFDWTMELPTDWSVVDAHPATWKNRVDRLVDDVFAGRRLSSAQRRDVRDYLSGVVASAQKAGILLTLVKFGLDDAQEPEAVGLTVRWASNAPGMASLATVRRSLANGGRVEEATGANGARMVIRHQRRSQVSGGATAKVTHLQAFLPVSGTRWTLVATMSTKRTDIDEHLDALLRRCVGSVRVQGDGGGAEFEAEAPEAVTVTRFEAAE